MGRGTGTGTGIGRGRGSQNRAAHCLASVEGPRQEEGSGGLGGTYNLRCVAALRKKKYVKFMNMNEADEAEETEETKQAKKTTATPTSCAQLFPVTTTTTKSPPRRRQGKLLRNWAKCH